MRFFGSIITLFLVLLTGVFEVHAQQPETFEQQLEAVNKLAKQEPEKAIALAHGLKKQADQKQLALVYQVLLGAHQRVGMIDSAVYYGMASISIAQKLGSEVKEASFIEKLARLYRNTGESEKALELYHESLAIYENLEDSAKMGHVENSIGISHKKMGQYMAALEHYERALAIREALGDKNRIAQTINNIGNVFRLQGKLDSALRKYLAALAVFEELNDSTNMTNSLNNIGLIHKRNGDSETALKYYNRVLEIRLLRNDQRGLQSIRNNIAIIYRERGMRDSALYFFNQNYDYAWSHGIKDAEALALHNAASIYMDDEQWEKALNGFRESAEIRAELKDRYGTASSKHHMAEVYFRMGDPKSAIPHAEEALEISKEIGSNMQTAEIYKLLHKSHAAVGNYGTAYLYHTMEKAISDSILAEEQAKTIEEMQAIYEDEKKAQQIREAKQQNAIQEEKIRTQTTTRNLLYGIIGVGLIVVVILIFQATSLRKANQQLVKQKEELGRNAEEKQMLLNEIHHRVKNNLQVVSSMLNMQSREVKDEKVLSALKEGRDRVHSMALVHQMFYQEQEDAASVEAGKYVEKLCHSLMRSYGAEEQGIQLQLDINEVLLDIDRATLVGLILNELVSNSLKYAFNGSGKKELTVSLRSGPKNHILQVSDSGTGKKSSDRKPESFGLKLVQSMTKKLKGKLSTYTEDGYSTRIEFPKTK